MAKGLRIGEAGVASKINDNDKFPIDQGDGTAVTATIKLLRDEFAKNVAKDVTDAAKAEAQEVMTTALAEFEERLEAIGK